MGFESVVISLTFLLFKEPSSCSPFWLLTIYIPSICIKELAFLQTLSTIVCRLFEKGPSDRFEKIPRCSFGWHFFNRDPEPLFTYSLAIWMPSWRSVHLNHWPIFLLGCLFVFFFFDVELHELFACVGDEFLVGILIWKPLLFPIWRWTFSVI